MELLLIMIINIGESMMADATIGYYIVGGRIGYNVINNDNSISGVIMRGATNGYVMTL